MTLGENLRKKVSETPASKERREWAQNERASGWAVQLTTDSHDHVGCLVWEITCRRETVQANLSLNEWASQFTQRVTGLLEPLKVLEVDTLRNEAILRSQLPQKPAGKIGYYELFLKGTTQATLRRFQAQTETKRQQIPFTLTNDGLAKLVNDICGT